MEQSTRESPWLGRLLRNRWALEPALAAALLAAWTLSALRGGGYGELSATLLLTAAVAASRLSPGGALLIGAVAVALQFGGLIPGFSVSTWVISVAGLLVVFGAAAYGSLLVRWSGFAAALLLSISTTLVAILPAIPAYQPGTPDWPFLWALLRFAGWYAGVGTVVAALVVGAWLLGMIVARRAASPDVERGALETWLTRGDVWSPVPLTRGDAWPAGAASAHGAGPSRDADRDSGLSLRMTRPQLVVDLSVALLFGVIGLLSTASRSGAELVVLALFSGALLLRRASPPVALGIAWLAAVAQMALRLGVLGSDVAVVVVLYATAAYGGRVTRWVGLASAGVGAGVAASYLTFLQYGAVPLGAAFDSANIGLTVRNLVTFFVASAAVLGLAWTLGFLVRTRVRARLSRSRAALALEEQRAAERSVVVEQERTRIARDMHDVVAHSLAVVIAQADGARYARADDPAAADVALTTIAATAREALGDVRILLSQLRKDDAAGPQPVLTDLGRLLEQMRSAGLALSWIETGEPRPLGSGGQLAVYRIVQEALTNALRHGQPGAAVRGSLQWDDAGVTATVENAVPPDRGDDGVTGVGHGLPGMRERALLAGGTLAVNAPPGGFRVVARIPAPAPGAPTPGATLPAEPMPATTLEGTQP